MELSYNGSGIVFYKNNEYRCDLYLNEDEGGIIFNIYVSEALASFIELPFEIDYLYGKLDNGFSFTSFGCSRTKVENRVSEGRSVFTFQARSLLKGVGTNYPNGTLLYKVQFELADILDWGGVSGYKIGENQELTNGDPVSFVLFDDKQIVIKYLVSRSLLPIVNQDLLKDRIELKQRGIIEIQSQIPETYDFYETLFRKIKRLIEISMRKTIRLTDVTGWSHCVFYRIEEEHIEMPISILTVELYKTNQDNNDSMKRWEWISLSELLEYNSFCWYLKKYDTLEPIIELYLEAFSPKGVSPERLFLNLVQGLETYHSRFITNDIKVFKQRIKSVILKNKPEQVVEEYTSFLMANSHKFITLESRLADLQTANFEVFFDTGDIHIFDFPGVIANTRNYLIHYDETIKKNKRVLTDEEVGIYSKTLISMLEYYLLRELGFTDTSIIKNKLKNRWGSVSTTLSIIKASKDKEKTN